MSSMETIVSFWSFSGVDNSFLVFRAGTCGDVEMELQADGSFRLQHLILRHGSMSSRSG